MTFQRPSHDELMALAFPLRLARKYVQPVFYGLDLVPDTGPMVFVGNHQLFGVLDVPFLFYELYEKKNLYLRGVGDKHHFIVPGWRLFLQRYGVINGTRENCRPILAAGESLLIFPGGGREVAKRKGEQYQLIWKERLGFVKLALEFGCPIVPFAAIGVEDAFEIVWDGDEILASPAGKILRAFGVPEYAVLPVVKGSGASLIPRPQPMYFAIGEPVTTTQYRGQQDDDTVCRVVRDTVKSRVEMLIDELQSKRQSQ